MYVYKSKKSSLTGIGNKSFIILMTPFLGGMVKTATGQNGYRSKVNV